MTTGNPYIDIFIKVGTEIVKFFTRPAVQLTLFVASGVNAHIKTQELKKTGQEILLTKFGTGDAMPVIYGTRRVAGTVVYMNTAQYQKELFVVYAIAGHEIDSFNLETLQIDGRPVSDVQVYRDGFIASDGTTRITSSGGRGTKASGNFFGSTQTEIDNVLAGTNPPNRPRMVFNCHTGATTQAADPMLVGCVNSWTTDHKLSGIAYIACNFEYDTRGQFTGLPNLTVVVNGKKLYDPRADGSISGGTGSQRANDASTHTWSANPSLALLDYMTDDDYGKGLDPTETTGDIDLGSFQTAADACDVSADSITHSSVVVESANTSTDVLVIANANEADFNNFKIGSTFTVTDGVTTYINNKRLIDKDIGQITDATDTAVATLQLTFEDGAVGTAITSNTTCTFTETQVKFDCHGVIDTEESILENTKALVANMRGIFTYSNGQYSIKVEGAESSVVTLDEDDIFESGLNLSLENKEAKFNKVEAEFYNAQKRYETDTTYYTGESGDDFLTDDGDEILETRIQLPFCTNQRIAYNHAKALLKRSRSQKTVAFVATPKVLKARVGEVITITSSNMGLSNALFRITNMVINPDLNIEVTAIEYQSDIYGYVTPPDESIGVINDPVDGQRVEAPTNLQFSSKNTSTGEPAKLTWTDSTKYPSYEFRVVIKTGNTSTIPNKTRFDRRTKETFFYLDGINIDSGFTAFVSAINTLGVESDAVELDFAVTTAPVTTPDIEQGSIGGFNFNATKMYYGTAGNFNNTDTAVYFDNAGQFSLKDKLSWNGTTLDISGNLTVENTISADKILLDGINLDDVISASTVGADKKLTATLGEFSELTVLNELFLQGEVQMNSVEIITQNRELQNFVSLELDSNTPATTTNKLYQASGTLYWNGNQVGVGAINSVTNMADNRVLTASGSNSANGEANLTFDGSTLDVNGNINITEFIKHRGDNDTYLQFTDDDISLFAGGVEFISMNEAGSDTITLHQNTTASGNLIVSGDLTVNGVTTTLNTATLDVEDKNITLNYSTGDSSASANGAGITIQDAVDASTDATILWDATNDEFDFSHGINVSGTLKSTNATGLILDTGASYRDVQFVLTGNTGNGTLEIIPMTVPGSGTASFTTHIKNLSVTGTTRHDLKVDGTINSGAITSTGLVTASELTITNDAIFNGGAEINGDASFGDNNKAIFGAGSDLQIYHDGTDSKIVSDGLKIERTNGEVYIQPVANAGVKLFWNGAERFDTTSSGVEVTGTISSGDITVNDQIIASGDSDTYLQFHAADQFRVVTGGAERLEVNTSETKLTAGNLNVISGQYLVNGQAVITNARALTNISSVTTSGDISLTGGGVIKAPSVTGGEGLGLEAAGTITVRIDTNGNSGDDQFFKVLKHTNDELFTVQETGNATFAGTISSGSITTSGDLISSDGDINHYINTSTRIFKVDSTGIDIKAGGLKIGNTLVADMSRNLTNIGTISSGAITSTGTSTFGISNIKDGSNPLIYFRDASNTIEGGIGFGSVTDGLFRIAVGNLGLITDTVMTINSSGNAVFDGTISSGAITASAGSSGATLPSNRVITLEDDANAVMAIAVPTTSEGGLFFPRDTVAYYAGIARNNTNLLLKNNNATALTLDSSLNATFAGTISSGAITSSGQVYADELRVTNDSLFEGSIDATGQTIASGAISVTTATTASGTRTPFYALHTNQNTIQITQFGQSHATAPAVNQIGVSNAEQHLHLVTDTSANVAAGSSTKGIFLRSGGNVGVGTQSPSEKLDVVGGGLGVGNGTIKTVISYNTRGVFGTTSNHDLEIRTNNTERMRLDSSGNLLVGQTSALWDDSARGNVEINGSSTAILALNTGGARAGYIYQSGDDMSIVNTKNSFVRIFTNDTERFRIDSSGRVGIGETDPDRQLHLTNSSLALAKIESTAAQYAGIDFKNTSRLWYAGIRVELGHGFGIKDEDANRVRLAIDTSGNVDIPQGNFEIGGTQVISSGRELQNTRINTTSGSTHSIKSTVSGSVYSDTLFLGNTTSGGHCRLGMSSNDTDGQHHRATFRAQKGSGQYEGELVLQMRAAGGGFNDDFIFKSGGTLGVGTTSPDDELHIRSTAQAGAGFRLENSNTSTDANTVYGTINFEGNDASGGASGIRGSIVGGSDGTTGAMSLEFSTASAGGSNTERMRITSGGTVGIATTSPSASYKLDVNGKIRSQQEILINTGSLFVNQEGEGIHLLSPNGTEYKITVDNSGNLVATEQ